jgi:hypothetical protein
MSKLYYAGIGSRTSPKDVLKVMKKFGRIFAERGWVLRSGGAEGADSAFEEGCDLAKGEKEIYLPWENFNKNKSTLYLRSYEIPLEMSNRACEIASKYHPKWETLGPAARALHARNGFQILGKDLITPVSLVLFWSPMITKGGTAQALRIAADHSIMMYNMGSEIDTEKLIRGMEKGGNKKYL